MKKLRRLQRQVRDRSEPRRPGPEDYALYAVHGPTVARNRVLKHVRGKKILIHGARALNRQVPAKYRKPTEDWDLLVERRALQVADKLEDSLDSVTGTDSYHVRVLKVGASRYVFRIIGLDGKPVVDVGSELRLPEHVIINRIRWESLRALRVKAVAILADKQYAYRWEKARSQIRRIDAAMKARERKPDMLGQAQSALGWALR